MLHILDPANLFRIIQGGEMEAESFTRRTPLHAFDHLLVKRVETAMGLDTPDFQILYQRSE
jgi:hypothetical protein